MTAKHLLVFTFMLVFLAGGVMMAGAQDEKKPDEKKVEYTYTGVKTCKMCHNKEATGAQYAVWEKTSHAKAYEVLASDESKAKAKEMGLGDPQKAPECLKCHVTAFPVMGDLENQKITLEEGVSCESCHGPGSGYKSMSVMKALYAGETKPETVGLIMPDEKTCTGCHNKENPFHKEFNFAEAVKKIAHPVPEAKE